MQQHEPNRDSFETAREHPSAPGEDEQDEELQDHIETSSDSSSSSEASSQFSGDAAEIAALRRTDDQDPTLDNYEWEEEEALLGKTVRIYSNHQYDISEASSDISTRDPTVEVPGECQSKQQWARRMSLIGVVETFLDDQMVRVRLHPGRVSVEIDKEKLLVIETPLGRPDWAMDNDEARMYQEDLGRYEQQVGSGLQDGQHVWTGPTVTSSSDNSQTETGNSGSQGQQSEG